MIKTSIMADEFDQPSSDDDDTEDALGWLEAPALGESSSSDEAASDSSESSDGGLTSASPHGCTLRNTARAGPPVRAWHDAVPSARERAALAADARRLVGRTFWIEEGDEPACAAERLALDVLRFHSKSAGAPDLRGAEWWAQVRTSAGSPTIEMHWDSDEEHKASTGEHLPPWLATVTYLGSAGAPTLVLPVGADAHGRARRLRAGGAAFVSQPVAGKHLAFDGRLLHGALHALEAPSPSAYERISVLVNLWACHRPDAHRLDGAEARALAAQSGWVARGTAPGEAALAGARSAACVSADAGLLDASEWRTLRVRFTPERRLLARHPDWRALGIGFPFAHPAVQVRGLVAPAGRAVPSLTRVRAVGLRLPFEAAEAAQAVAHGAACALLCAAAQEVAAAADWRARRGLRAAVAQLRPYLAAAPNTAAPTRSAAAGAGTAASAAPAAAPPAATAPCAAAAELLRADDADDDACAADATATLALFGWGDGGEDGGEARAAEVDDRPPVCGGVWSRPALCGEAPLVYLAREGLEASALCVLSGAAGVEIGREIGRRDRLEIDRADVDGFSALHYACNLGLARLAAALLERGACTRGTTRDVPTLSEPRGRTPLHLAAAAGQAGIARALVRARADARALDGQGASPAHLACRRGHWRLAQALLRPAPGARREGAAAEPEEGLPEGLPSEQEMRGFELAEAMSVRARDEARRCIEHRPLLHAPLVLGGLLGPAACSALTAAAERCAARRGWQSTRHTHHPTVDLPLHDLPATHYAGARRALERGALPRLRAAYGTRALAIREAFVVKYEAAEAGQQSHAPREEAGGARARAARAEADVDAAAAVDAGGVARPAEHGRAPRAERPRQAGLALHKDGTLLNCVVLLSPAAAFAGGGTVFAHPVDRTYRVEQGDCLCSCGQLLHGAAPVTRGVRYVLIAFIDEVGHQAHGVDDDDGDGSSSVLSTSSSSEQ